MVNKERGNVTVLPVNLSPYRRLKMRLALLGPNTRRIIVLTAVACAAIGLGLAMVWALNSFFEAWIAFLAAHRTVCR